MRGGGDVQCNVHVCLGAIMHAMTSDYSLSDTISFIDGCNISNFQLYSTIKKLSCN